MSITAAWTLIKTFGPWIVLALIIAYVGTLQLDRNHLAGLNRAHSDCLASVQARPGSKPIGTVCEPVITQAVTLATSAQACDSQLASTTTGVPSICSGPVQRIAADRDAQTANAANLRAQLAQAQIDQTQAVARATARAHADAQRTAHVTTVLDAQPRDAAGHTVCDARCLRDLASVSPADD